MVQGLFVLCLLGFSRSLAISVTHSVTPHSITVSWSDGAAYLYKPILKLDKSIVSSAVLPATADEYTFTGLKSNTEYDLSLKTVNLVGKEETPYPDTKVKVLAAAPRSPQDLVYTKVSSNSISLSWENDPSDKDGVSYDVVYGTKDGNTMRKETLSSSINLDNLEEGKYYYVSV
uniref:Fibronectin type-III domain-containing protein n=1 Tax=Mesocestoides corti TaxID=53468 RepID=A0A5K3EHA3_MESCO